MTDTSCSHTGSNILAVMTSIDAHNMLKDAVFGLKRWEISTSQQQRVSERLGETPRGYHVTLLTIFAAVAASESDHAIFGAE